MEDKKEDLIAKPLEQGKSRCFSLLMYFSHLCLVFPAEVSSLSEDKKTASFFVSVKEDDYTLGEWLDVFRFNFPYKLQSVLFGEEKEPFSLSAKLTDKKILDGKLSLEFCFFEEFVNPSFLEVAS